MHGGVVRYSTHWALEVPSMHEAQTSRAATSRRRGSFLVLLHLLWPCSRPSGCSTILEKGVAAASASRVLDGQTQVFSIRGLTSSSRSARCCNVAAPSVLLCSETVTLLVHS